MMEGAGGEADKMVGEQQKRPKETENYKGSKGYMKQKVPFYLSLKQRENKKSGRRVRKKPV